MPVPPPRPKRDQRKMSESSAPRKSRFPSTKTSQPKSPAPLPSNPSSSLRRQLKNVRLEATYTPENYLEPVTSCAAAVGRESEDDDDEEGVGDYIDMAPGVLTEWLPTDHTPVEEGTYSIALCY